MNQMKRLSVTLLVGLALLVALACERPEERDTTPTTTEAVAEDIANEAEQVMDELDQRRVHLKAKLALLEELPVEALRIDVDVENGTVRLSGDVKEDSSIELAETIVGSIEEVREVNNDLVLAETEEAEASAVEKTMEELKQEVADAVIVAKVKTAMIDEVGRNAFSVDVKSVLGNVTLDGTVEEQATKELVLKAAESVDGVKKVIDLMDVSAGDKEGK